MKKEDIVAKLEAEIQHVKDDYYGKDPEAKKIVEGLNYDWKLQKTHAEWEAGIIDVLDACMRMGASLGSWMKSENRSAQRAARVAFDAIQKEMLHDIERAVNAPHDDEIEGKK